MLYPTGPMMDAKAVQPEQWATLKIFHPDGTFEHATWTGKVWWTYRGAVFPVRWQTVCDRRMGNPVASKCGTA